MDFVGVFVDLFKWLFEAAIRYNATPEGEAGLSDILAGIEALGIDVPFWSPPEDEQPLDIRQQQPVDGTQEAASAAAFRARHPELNLKEME